MQFFILSQLILLLTFRGFGETSISNIVINDSGQNSGVRITEPYTYPTVFPPQPTPTSTPTPTPISDNWTPYGSGYATYYSASYGNWEAIRNAHIRFGHLPSGFNPSPEGYYLACTDDSLMGKKFKIKSLSNENEVIAWMADAVNINHKQNFYNKGIVIDVSYPLAEVIGKNSKVLVWVEY